MVACNRKETFHLHRVEHRFFFKKSDRIFGQVFHCGGIFRTVAAFFALSGGSKDVNRSDQLIMALSGFSVYKSYPFDRRFFIDILDEEIVSIVCDAPVVLH